MKILSRPSTVTKMPAEGRGHSKLTRSCLGICSCRSGAPTREPLTFESEILAAEMKFGKGGLKMRSVALRQLRATRKLRVDSMKVEDPQFRPHTQAQRSRIPNVPSTHRSVVQLYSGRTFSRCIHPMLSITTTWPTRPELTFAEPNSVQTTKPSFS